MASNRLKFTITPDLDAAIESAVNDISFSGLGDNGDSEFEVEDVSVENNGDGTWTVNLGLTRTEGKFVSNDDLLDNVMNELTTLDDVSLEVN